MSSENDILNYPGRLRWYRFSILLDIFGKPILAQIFHKTLLAPDNCTKELYSFLLEFKKKLNLFKDEHPKVFPPNEITDEEKFDISLFGKIINTIWNKYETEKKFSQQDPKDIKKAKDCIASIKKWRNLLCHEEKVLSELSFEEFWQEAEDYFQNYGVDMASASHIKTGNIFSDENEKVQESARLLLQGMWGRLIHFSLKNKSV